MVLVWVSFVIKDAECFFICLLAIFRYFFSKCSRFLPIWKNWSFYFTINYRVSHCILERGPLLDLCIVKLSPCLWFYLFILIVFSFMSWSAEFWWNWIYPYMFMMSAFCVHPRNFCLIQWRYSPIFSYRSFIDFFLWSMIYLKLTFVYGWDKDWDSII